jgi:hypothetical protein
MALYRICWTDEKGLSGNGDLILSIELGRSWIERLRERYPEMKHWLSTI